MAGYVEKMPPAADLEDGFTLRLTERNGETILWMSQGDFSAMPNGHSYGDFAVKIWDRALARIRCLAEGRPS